MTLSHKYSHLNKEQQRAIVTIDGRVLILAGAGSGKTSVLSYRIAYLLEMGKAEPEQILGLTFTNKAAHEMRERVAKIVGPTIAKKITLSTFHSFCMQILRKEINRLGYTSQFSLYDERDVKRLVTQLARHLLEHESELPSLEGTLQKIQHAKCRGIAKEEIGDDDNPNWHKRFSQDLFERLQVSMRAYNAVDFDSLLSLTVQLFEEHPEVLQKYQERFRYIMIDEYQDTNPIQYRLAQLLSRKYNNLCVVGDDDQSIYGWRGAEIQNILKFESSTIIKLEQNYRSTSMILHAANSVICNNQERHNKSLWSTHKSEDPIILFHAPTDADEAQSVVARMIALRKKNKWKWSDFAILYRSNILSRPFEFALMQGTWEHNGNWVKGIPYQVFGGTELSERSEIKDLMAYLKAIANPKDQEALLRIINVPRRGISDNALDILTQANRAKGIPLYDVLVGVAHNSPAFAEIAQKLSDKGINGIRSFLQILEKAKEKFATSSLSAACSSLLEEINYKKAIEEEVKSEKMREFKWENVSLCVEVMAKYEEETRSKNEDVSLHGFLMDSLLDDEKFESREKKFSEDQVNLMTFHSAKGLEFEACFLVGLEDHIIPHEKSLSGGSLEEERRLLYVGMTRAKKHLTLSMARQRKKMGKDIKTNPSRFLFEIPKELLQITSWHTID